VRKRVRTVYFFMLRLEVTSDQRDLD
jgi:hypothetical protein